MDINAIFVVIFSLFCEAGLAVRSCLHSSQYEHSGVCCGKCRPGTFVLSDCSNTTETVCGPCKGGTFSEEWTSLKECKRCSRCQPMLDVVQVCNATVDNQCGCVKANQFHHLPSDSCRQCKSCPPGQYPLHPCTGDTICSSCPTNYFSNVTRNYKQRCKKCTRCKKYSRKCSPTKDSVCRYDVHDVTTKKISTTSKPKTSAESTPTLTTGKSNSTATHSKESAHNFFDPIKIAVVCVIIVLLIIVAAILYFRRKKRALSDECLANQLIIEESKGKALSFEGALLRDQSGEIILKLHTMLNPDGPNNWKALATKIGVPYSLIRNFEGNIDTATKEMLHHWSTSNGATVDKLYQALKSLGRDDACKFLEENLAGNVETVV